MKTNKLWKKVLSLGLCAALVAGCVGIIDLTTAFADSSKYLIGLKGTADNDSAIVKDNEYAEVVSTANAPKDYEGNYSYHMADNPDTEWHYVNIVLEYDGNVVGRAPESNNAYAYLAYEEGNQTFKVNPADGYQVSGASLTVTTEAMENVTTKTVDLSVNENGICEVTLNKRNSNEWTDEKYYSELKIVLEEAEEETSNYVDFKANLFKYKDYAMNTASMNQNASKYLNIGVKGGAGDWNVCNYDGVYQGLADMNLTDGLISFSNYGAKDFFTSEGREDEKSGYYTTSEKEKTSYYNVTFPFEKDGDSYIYDSSKKSATLNTENGTVSIGDANGGFWPFGVNNYYFGMNFVTDFFMTEDGKINGEDIVFEFSGDDDVWVYIDGNLVLDIGGIHGAVAGSINFSTGEVSFYSAGTDAAQKGVIKESAKAGYITTANKSGGNIVSASYNFYDSSANNLTRANLLDGDSHELQVYYMERGAGKSNCKIKFNLPQKPQQNTLKVTNTVKNTVNGAKVEDDTAFTYVIRKDGEVFANAFFTLKAADGKTTSVTTTADGKFTLKDGESALFAKADTGNYTVSEVLESGYETKYTASKNGSQTSAAGPVIKSTSVTTLEAAHSIQTKVNQANDFYQIDFVNTKSKEEKTFDSGKTTTLVDWNERTYDITLTASSTTEYTTGGDTVVTTEKPAVDVILVLDMSSSMNGTPTTDLKAAATGFVTNLSQNVADGSKIAVIKYNSKAEVLQELTTLTTSNASDINKKINNMKNSTGTYTSLGLETAQGILANCTNPNKYVILFSDGEPYLNGIDQNKIADDSYDCATEMKEAATLYTVRLGSKSGGTLAYGDGTNNYKKRSYVQWLEDLATDKAHALGTTNSSDLSMIFEAIRSEITTPTETTTVALTNAKVVDTLDARFELTADEKTRLESDGATVTVNEDGTTTITWINQTLHPVAEADGVTTPGWSKVIHIRAKEDYIGGNDIATNVNPDSYIEVSGESPVEFEQPKVNVKITNELKGDSDTIFLGENLKQYFTEEKESEMIGDIIQMKTYGDTQLSIKWFDKDRSEVVAEDIRNASPEEQTSYTLKVVVTPKTAEGSAEAKAAAESMKNSDGIVYVAETYEEEATYKVNVVTGSITITKKINKKSYNEKDGDPIFTYQVTNLLNGKVYYRTVRFDVNQDDTYVTTDQVTEENHLFSTDYYVCSAQITDLPQGLYKVEELDTMGFSLDKVGTDTKNTSAVYGVEDTYAVYAIGYDLSAGTELKEVLGADGYHGLISGPADSHLKHKDASVIFVNKKVRTPGKETDTDVVKNSLVIDQTYTGNYKADNMQQ